MTNITKEQRTIAALPEVEATYANPAKADHLHEPYITIKAAGQRDRRTPVPTNFANAAAAPLPDAQQKARIAELEAALETARNGLLWYHDTYPEAVNECDEEAIAGIEAILKEETM